MITSQSLAPDDYFRLLLSQQNGGVPGLLSPDPTQTAQPDPNAAPSQPSWLDNLLSGMGTPAGKMALLQAGANMLQNSGPSTTPRSAFQILGGGLGAGIQGYTGEQQRQLEMAAQKQAMGANQWRTLSPDETKQVMPGGIKPGYVLQQNGNGEYRTVGQDVFTSSTGYDANGYPITGPVDVRKLGTGGVPGTGGAGGNTQKIAHLIATYQMAPLSSFAMRTPSGQAIMAAVAAENPSYNANNFTEYQKGFKDFGTGKQGTQVKSFGVALAHLDTLQKLGDALQNGNTQMLNSASNLFKSQFGQSAPTSFEAAKQIVGDEIVKAVTGAGGALGDRESAQKQLSQANSPAQLRQVINTYKQLMAGQLMGLKRQFESSTGRTDFEEAMKLPPEVIQQLEGGQTSAPAAQGTLTYDPTTGTFK